MLNKEINREDLSNAVINIKNNLTVNYPFDHPNYVKRVQEKEYTVTLSDGNTLTRVKSNMILTEEMPYEIKSAIGGFRVMTPLGYFDTRSRGTHRKGKKNVNLARVLTERAMEYIRNDNSQALKDTNGNYYKWVFKMIQVQQTSNYRKRNR